MRVAFDARWYNGYGVGTYVAQLLNALSEFSHEFDLVVLEDPRNPVPIAESQGVSRVKVRSARFSLASQFELREICKSERIDILHLPFQYGVPFFLPCLLVITVHDLIPFLFPTRSWYKQLALVPFVKLAIRASATRANHVITVSHKTADDVQRLLKVSSHRITAIHNAVSGEVFRPIDGSNGEPERKYLFAKHGVRDPYVIVASAHNWRIKNLEMALRVLALVREASGINFQVVAYGPEDGLNVLVQRKSTFGLDIHRLGYLAVDDLAAIFRHAQLFLCTSLYEGFGLPILEAMACGCPVVTSNGGSLREVAADGAQAFDAMDAEGMAQAVAKLLRSAEEREWWRERALARSADFSWRKAAEQTLGVYRQVYGPVRDRGTKEVGYANEHQSTPYQKAS